MSTPFRLERRVVVPISLPYLFQLASELEPLQQLPTARETVPFNEIFGTLYQAHHALSALLNTSVFSPYLRSSNQLGGDLYGALSAVVTRDGPMDRPVFSFTLWSITSAYEKYKVALLAELGVFPSYFVTQKGSHDTLSLLTRGLALFPADLAMKVPDARFDVIEAAKALAFELPTACGFHAFRATESVLRRYYAEVAGGKAQPKVRNIGVYVNAMKQAGHGDPKVLAVLKQLADLHRNPLIHPEVALTVEEALTILGLARSAVASMLAQLPPPPQTTTTASVQGTLGSLPVWTGP